jgi:hypothetical protein
VDVSGKSAASSSLLRQRQPSVRFPAGFPTKTLHAYFLLTMLGTITACFTYLFLITSNNIGQEYKLLCSSL